MILKISQIYVVYPVRTSLTPVGGIYKITDGSVMLQSAGSRSARSNGANPFIKLNILFRAIDFFSLRNSNYEIIDNTQGNGNENMEYKTLKLNNNIAYRAWNGLHEESEWRFLIRGLKSES